MGKNLRGGYKLIPLPIDLDTYEGQDAVVFGIYSKIKSTKKRIVLISLIVAGALMNDLSVEVELKSNGKLFISNAYGYDLTIDSNDKVSVASHVDTSVVANPTLAGTEDNLSGLEVNGTKYKVPSGINVVANPTLEGTESALSGLEVGSTKYKVISGTTLYLHSMSLGGGNMLYLVDTRSIHLSMSNLLSGDAQNIILNARVSGPTYVGAIIDINYIVLQDKYTAVYLPSGDTTLNSFDITSIENDTVIKL